MGAAINLKDALLAEIRRTNLMAYNALVVQAKRMDVAADRVVLTFAASQKMGTAFEKYRPAIEAMATKLAGRKMSVVADMTAKEGAPGGDPDPVADAGRKSALKEQALADASVQALLEVFPAEIRDVEEM